jgi:hypothetical protein
MILSFELIVLGIVTLIYLITLSGIGIKMGLTYFKSKNTVFIWAGISVFGTALPWSAPTVYFLSLVFFDDVPPMEVYFLLMGGFLPIASITWMITILTLFDVKPPRVNYLKVFFIIFWLIIEVIYLTLVFTDTTLLGTLEDNRLVMNLAPVAQIFLLIALAQMLITTYMLGIYYWRSDRKKIKVQGKIITFALCLFLVAGVLEVFIPTVLMNIVARILVMVYAFVYYGGFMMPEWLEKLLIKESKDET